MPSIQGALQRRPIRFLLVGAWNTGFGYVLFAGLYTLSVHLHIHYLAALVTSQILGILQAYVLYKYTVFKTPDFSWLELARFSSVYAVQFAINMAALPLLVTTLHWNPLLAQAVVVPAIVSSSYIAHNRFSFSVGPQ